ncbi:PREDICTED: C-C motif chemokine 1 [Chinchilla lanigera]|uniref:C-C motif chemokine 1 n=1 Tax=Chinchilla lanigera TaxID=34839 RepID=A0A8C2V282_CHILA|nr:PREDICTED: C-C motif chemokine 1 [Chinchilla lanigera]XP_005402899.1 PREDICTED: C-C motif chemokine 1 [Chinchilla lanigera]
MKLATVALACLLLAAMWTQDVDGMSLHVSSSHCCYSSVEKKISLRRIQCHRVTSSTCPYKAVIFKLKGGREACVLPTLGWVQGYLKKVKPCWLKGK